MIQWFPGHMAKARNEIIARLKLVDIVFELLDARIPFSSRNPLFQDLIKNKPRIILLTKSTLADSKETMLWSKYYSKDNAAVLEIDAISGFNINMIEKKALMVLAPKLAKEKEKGFRDRPIRAMILGIPNVGKSTLINTLVSKKATRVGNRPGVTRAQQWIRINPRLELLDTPGVLWPKFEDQKIGIHLALTGAIKDELLRPEDLGIYLLNFLEEYYPKELQERYQIDISLDNFQNVEKIAQDCGFFQSDYQERTYNLIINDFRSNRLGPITLDRYQED